MPELTETTQLAGRVAVVTGAGAGLGRAEALALAEAGADIVVNDIGAAADDVVDEITSTGARAVAVPGDVGDWAFGEKLVNAAVDTFGRLDIVVNNAGVVADGMLFNLTESNWDDVIRVHLKGHAAVSHAAAVYFRQASKSAGEPVYGRIINTTSEAFLFGSAGQPNYASAKAGITALTLSTAQSLSRYGVRTNAICPRARTGMTEDVFAADPQGDTRTDILAPERVATLVSYLASPASADINGQVFVAYGDMIALLAPPTVEQKFTAAEGSFSADEIDKQLGNYFSGRDPRRTYAAYGIASLDTTGVENIAGKK